jgi:hypothetical protein
MKNYLLAFLLALLVVLTSMSLGRSAAGIGGAPVPVPPTVTGIGGAPVPVPPTGIGGAPVPVPPTKS